VFVEQTFEGDGREERNKLITASLENREYKDDVYKNDEPNWNEKTAKRKAPTSTMSRDMYLKFGFYIKRNVPSF
jgi:hypothetical protein